MANLANINEFAKILSHQNFVLYSIVLMCWNAVLERERLQEEATQRLSQPAISRRAQKVVTDQHIVL